jgi:outer membrane lipoprotein
MDDIPALCYIFRMIKRWWIYAAWVVLISSGCASTDESLESGPPRLTYAQVESAPDTYKGQTVTFGGKVLNARRLKEGTRIEILQLPLDSSLKPARDLRKSQGRFLAMRKEFLDPATIPAGTFITVTGDVAGSVTLPLDETDYLYPILEMKTLKVWPADDDAQPCCIRPYPYMVPGPYWGPYWSPYWRPWPYW